CSYALFYVIYFYILLFYFLFFFFNVTPTTEIYTLSLHDALPISPSKELALATARPSRSSIGSTGVPCSSISSAACAGARTPRTRDRKSTRLNSSHVAISYAVFCLKKKKKKKSTEHK